MPIYLLSNPNCRYSNRPRLLSSYKLPAIKYAKSLQYLSFDMYLWYIRLSIGLNVLQLIEYKSKAFHYSCIGA